MSDHDFIVVGGGSAGAIVAARLVGEFDARVLLLEAGAARGSWLLDLPAGYMKFLNRDDYLTLHTTIPQPQLDDRQVVIPQARLLGGGSAVNAMVYMRGQAQDYDDWDDALGHAGWAYEDLLPHFVAIEDNDTFGPPNHGSDGPIKVSHLGYHCSVSAAYVESCRSLGIAENADFNGPHQPGVGFMQHTIDAVRRKRSSTATAFLEPLRNEPRLKIKTNARVARIVLDKGRAVGVEYHHGTRNVSAKAGRGVIVAAGAIATPTLLMRSGIGPVDHLQQCGITPLHDLPGVGQNLHDHCEVPVVATTRPGLGYYKQDRGLRMLWNGIEYVLARRGRVTTTGVEACAFVASDGGKRPDLQVYCVPTVYLDRTVTGADPTYGVTLTPCLLRPKSRGSVRLNPAEPHGLPAVDPAYLRDPDDAALAVRGVEFAKEVMNASPLANMVTGLVFPTEDAGEAADLQRHCRQTVKTNYHPVGTCRMGRDSDPHAVVDSQLKVRELAGLYVADASVMPAIPSGNTNAPVMAIAHKAAEMIADV